MEHAEVQCAVAAHRRPGDAASEAPGVCPIKPIDRRHELLDEEVFVTVAAVIRVHVERFAAVGQDHQKLAHLPAFHQAIQDLLAAALAPASLVLKQAVQIIERRVSRGRG